MIVQFLFLLLPMVVTSKSLDMDISSIRIVPDLYRFCWRQYTAKNYGSIMVTNQDSRMSYQLPIFKDPQTKDNVYCIEKKDKISTYSIKLPLWGLREAKFLDFRLRFSVPLGPGLQVIRKKIVPYGVHFQLSPHFAGISNKSEIYCQILIIYGPNKAHIILFNMNLTMTKQGLMTQDGEKFDCYYICKIGSQVTGIVADHGTVFEEERILTLQPFLQFPFTRFLVGQWRNPKNFTVVYQIEIYEFRASNILNCLKVFRLYSSSKPVNTSNIYPKNCDKGVHIEDLGTINLISGRNVYVVLDMGVPLKKDVRYKFVIWWRNPSNQWQENFIYFEPLPNENSGNIHSDIYNYEPTNNISDIGNTLFDLYNYEPSNYGHTRSKISDMWQNVIPQYSTDISSAKFLNVSKFDEMVILPTVSTSPFKRLTSPKTMSYDELNEKCKDIPSCSNGFHPLFYVMLTNKSQTDNFVELLPIPLKENVYIDNLKLSSNSENDILTISWRIPQKKSNIPSLFAIRLRWENNTCFALYVLICRTCNKEHKEVSEKNFNESNSWKRDCQRYERFDNYFGAMDSLITVQIKEIVQGSIQRANVYSINLYEKELIGNINKETLWLKYRTVVISLLCTVFGLLLIIPIVIWIKPCVKRNMRNQSKRDDLINGNGDNEL